MFSSLNMAITESLVMKLSDLREKTRKENAMTKEDYEAILALTVFMLCMAVLMNL